MTRNTLLDKLHLLMDYPDRQVAVSRATELVLEYTRAQDGDINTALTLVAKG